MPLVTASRFRKRRTSFPVALNGTESVEVRYIDLMDQLMLGIMPTALLAGAQTVDTVYDQMSAIKDDKDDADKDTEKTTRSIIDVIAQLRDEQKRDMVAMLRRYAVNVIVAPKFSLSEEPSDENVAPISSLTTIELLAIFNARPPADVVADETSEPPDMSEKDVQSFREREPEPPAPAASAREELRDESVRLADAGLVSYASA